MSVEIPVDAIDRPDKPLRKDVSDDYLDELMFSMSKHGLIHAIRVKSTGSRYQVVTGDCRLQAAQRLHWASIECVLTDKAEGALREMQLHENLHRANLTPSEEATAVQIFYEDEHFSPSRIATVCGRSIHWVEERLDMASWPTGIMEAVDKKLISIGVGRVLNTIDDATALEYMTMQAVETGATVRQAATWVHNYKMRPWQLPTKEEIEAAKQQLEPLPVPMATCGGCELQTAITNLATGLLCPTCQTLLPQLRRTKT